MEITLDTIKTADIKDKRQLFVLFCKQLITLVENNSLTIEEMGYQITEALKIKELFKCKDLEEIMILGAQLELSDSRFKDYDKRKYLEKIKNIILENDVDNTLKPLIDYLIKKDIKSSEIFIADVLIDICQKDKTDALSPVDYKIIYLLAFNFFSYVSEKSEISYSQIRKLIENKFTNYKLLEDITFNVLNKTDNAVTDYDDDQLIQMLEDYKFSIKALKH